MASHEQSFRAGEAKGRTEERTNQMMESMKQKAEAAKDQSYETAQAAKENTLETTRAAKEKAMETSEATKEPAEEAKEKTGGLLHKTGEKVKHMAEAVKDTFGMANPGEDTGSPRETHVDESADAMSITK